MPENIIKNGAKIFTHCYSKTVIEFLKNAKKSGKKFEVFLSEVRPKLLGRRTAKALAEAKIKITIMPDLAAPEKIKECDLLLFGAESITKEGNVMNKIGSNNLLNIAQQNKIPAYCLTSVKKINAKIKRSQKPEQLWKKPPKGVSLLNPGFEEIKKDRRFKLIFTDQPPESGSE